MPDFLANGDSSRPKTERNEIFPTKFIFSCENFN